MGVKGEGGDKNLKKWVTSFMDSTLALTYHDNAILIFRGDKIHKLCNYFLQEKDYIYYILFGGIIQNKSFDLNDKKRK